MKLRESLSIDHNLKDTDDMKFFVLGVTTGILIGTVSTFIGNIMTHRWIQENGSKRRQS